MRRVPYSRTWFVAIIASLLCADLAAFKPKTHLHLALLSIDQILAGSDYVVIDSISHPVDPEVAAAIRAYPGDYLGGVVGPDGFPDLLFGQTFLHPDSRCTYEHDVNGECEESAGTWSQQWLAHVVSSARNRTGPDRQRAIAFAYGFLTHAAGDMWAHSFVNEFAGGSWPENLANPIAARHVIIEGVIGKHTPDITSRIQALGGLAVPSEFVYDTLIASDWARSESRADRHYSFVGLMLQLRDKLVELRPSEPTAQEFTIAAVSPLPSDDTDLANRWLIRRYLTCWIEEIDKGLRAWPTTSLRVADELFVRENTTRVFDPVLKAYLDDHLKPILAAPIDPLGLVTRCYEIPESIIQIVDPASALRTFVSTLAIPALPLLDGIKNQFRDYLFQEAFGLSYDTFVSYTTQPSLAVKTPLFNSANTLCDVRGLIGVAPCSNEPGLLSEATFAPAANTILMGKLILMLPEGLDKVLFHYSAGPLFAAASGFEDDKKRNVMLGFIRSLDGNHQWRDNAPPGPIEEGLRRFGNGMPFWKDCLSRRSFFRNVFRDWNFQGASTLYHGAGDEECIIASTLPPVTANFRIIGATGGGDRYFGTSCGLVGLVVELTNHQLKAQPYAILVTNDPLDVPQLGLCTSADEAALSSTGVSVPRGATITRARAIPAPVYYHRVVAGELPAIPTRGPTTTKIETIPLPNCGGGSYRIKAFLVAQMSSINTPPLIHNRRIASDAAALLSEEVVASYDANIEIRRVDCPTRPACQPGQTTTTRSTSFVTESGPMTVTFVVPCTGAATCLPPTPCDADLDGIKNDLDICPVTVDAAQTDSDGDGKGDACDLLDNRARGAITGILKQWADRMVADVRWADVQRRYPELFVSPTLDAGWTNPIPGPKLLSSADFRDVTTAFLRGDVKEDSYFAEFRAVAGGVRTSGRGVTVNRGTLVARQEVRLQVRSSGGKLTVQLPLLMLRAPSAASTKRLHVMTADGKHLSNDQYDTASVRTLSIEVPHGVREVIIQRR